MNINSKFTQPWILWYHHERNNWSINGYKKIIEINTIQDFWKLYNTWDKIGGVNNKHYFLMRENVHPIWEDDNNIKGGCWSFKVSESESKHLWEDLSKYIITENITQKPEEITGISICLKKNSFSVIKIWNKNSSNNSLSLINENILKKWGTDIIYIAHITDKSN